MNLFIKIGYMWLPMEQELPIQSRPDEQQGCRRARQIGWREMSVVVHAIIVEASRPLQILIRNHPAGYQVSKSEPH